MIRALCFGLFLAGAKAETQAESLAETLRSARGKKGQTHGFGVIRDKIENVNGKLHIRSVHGGQTKKNTETTPVAVHTHKSKGRALNEATVLCSDGITSIETSWVGDAYCDCPDCDDEQIDVTTLDRCATGDRLKGSPSQYVYENTEACECVHCTDNNIKLNPTDSYLQSLSVDAERKAGGQNIAVFQYYHEDQWNNETTWCAQHGYCGFQLESWVNSFITEEKLMEIWEETNRKLFESSYETFWIETITVWSLKSIPNKYSTLGEGSESVFCDDGTEILKSWVNDEYCDCNDCEDEGVFRINSIELENAISNFESTGTKYTLQPDGTYAQSSSVVHTLDEWVNRDALYDIFSMWRFTDGEFIGGVADMGKKSHIISYIDKGWGTDFGPYFDFFKNNVVAHEILHNLGMNHAYFNQIEYGDLYDIMGSRYLRRTHDMSVPGKHALGWIQDKHLAVTETSQFGADATRTFKIAAFDAAFDGKTAAQHAEDTEYVLGVRLDTHILPNRVNWQGHEYTFVDFFTLDPTRVEYFDFSRQQWYITPEEYNSDNWTPFTLEQVDTDNIFTDYFTFKKYHLWIQYRHAADNSRVGASLLLSSDINDDIHMGSALLHPDHPDYPDPVDPNELQEDLKHVHSAFLEEGETFVYDAEGRLAIVVRVLEVDESAKSVTAKVSYVVTSGECSDANPSLLCGIEASVVRRAVMHRACVQDAATTTPDIGGIVKAVQDQDATEDALVEALSTLSADALDRLYKYAISKQCI